MQDIVALRDALAAWFRDHGRRLAIRQQSDPWGVLVSEVMAQQTQIARVEPAWTAFMDAFPTAQALADASPAAVLRAWAGMGYNRRALNLQRAAAVIVERHGGQVPRTLEALEALPGVGPYTARAVAAIAYGVPVAAVDTNIRRVVGRVVAGHGSNADPGQPLQPRQAQSIADALVDPRDPAAWTHAVMDVGATVCRPANPRCTTCPVSGWCAWYAAALGQGSNDRQEILATTDPSRRVGTVRPRARRTGEPSFPTTRRWLRGRIVAALRDLPEGSWRTFREPLGAHDLAAVAVTLADLAGEGMLEQRPDGAVRLPSVRR